MNEFYYYVWAIYAVAGIGLLYLSWLLSRQIKVPALGMAFMALVVALLFTPAKLVPEQMDLTPALMIALFDGLLLGWPGFWGGLKYILLVYAGLLLLLSPVYLLKAKRAPKVPKAPKAPKNEAIEPTL